MHVLLTCKIHSSLPYSPKCLNAFQHICPVKRLICLSSNLGFNETWGLIHPKGKIPLQLWNQTNDLLPKYNGRTGIGKTFPFEKGEIRKKKQGWVPSNPVPSKVNCIRSQDSGFSPFSLMTHLPDPLEQESSSHGTAAWGLHRWKLCWAEMLSQRLQVALSSWLWKTPPS